MKSMRIVFGSLVSIVFLTICSSISVQSQDDNSAPALELGKAIERELASGERHDYRITLAAGEFARIVVEQRGIDVTVSLLAANGEKVAERVLNGRYGRMYLSILPQTTANYRIEAQASMKNATAGRYEIKMTDRRPHAEHDVDSVGAEQAATEGWRLGS